MASFKPHYSLCPVLGGNSLVGINQDKAKDSLLITLGANIIVEHKLSDQKPFKSWSTRQTNKLTSPALFSPGKAQYVGVLNHKHICTWQEDSASVEDAKKHTFQVRVSAIHSDTQNSHVIVVYDNGFSENLDVAVQTRKDTKPQLTAASETVTSSFLASVQEANHLVLFTTKSNVFCVRLDTDGTPEGHYSFSVERPSEKVLGKCVINAEKRLIILVLYSSGKLVEFTEQGTEIATHTVDGISLNSNVAMVSLDATRVAIYASDVSREGAVLLLMDLKFGISVATRKLKFFCDPPVLYCDHRNNVLLLCVGQNLVVVPYQLQPSLLAALVGKRQADGGVITKPEVGAWTEENQMQWDVSSATFKLADSKLQGIANELWSSGASHAKLMEELLPRLKETNDVEGICQLLVHVDDVPEKCHAELLGLALQEFNDEKKPAGKKLLNLLLKIPYSEILLLKHVRSKVSTQSAIRLIRYLSHLLANSDFMNSEESSEPALEQVLNWASLVLDSHYSQLLLCGADSEVHQMINELKKLVLEKYEFFEAVGDLEAIVNSLQQGKKIPENRRSDWYAIEVVQLF